MKNSGKKFVMLSLEETLTKFSAAVLQRDAQQELPIFTATTAANIKVYRHNYLFALLAALQRRYPSVVKILQPDNFKFFAREFIYAHPAMVSNIDAYGENFAAFLQQRRELQTMPYLYDLAQLDDVHYRHDPSYHVTVSEGSVALWENIQNDIPPAELAIDLTRQQRVSGVSDQDGNFYLKVSAV